MTLYTLLVGINEYQNPKINRLYGCLPDVNAIDSLLSQQAEPSGYVYEEQKLLNEQATRQNIIDGFEKHLHNAKPGDSVLFYFSGHGSQEKTAQDFRVFFPDGKNETLVCHDSRTTDAGGNYIYDLADKELAYLLSNINRGVHITVILDACHAGSGTRELGKEFDEAFFGETYTTRQIPASNTQRPLATYYGNFIQGGNVVLATSQHILLAACRSSEKAVETNKGGVFSYALNTVLRNQGFMSYSEVFEEARQLLLAEGFAQSPQFEPDGGFDTNQGFLGFSEAREATRYALYYNQNAGKWKVDAGAIHGLPIEPGKIIEMAVGGTVRLRAVEVSVSHTLLEVVEGRLDNTKRYNDAYFTTMGVPPLYIHAYGNEQTLNKLREAIALARISYLKLEDQENAKTGLVVEATADRIKILHPKTHALIEENISPASTRFSNVDRDTGKVSWITKNIEDIKDDTDWIDWTLYGFEHIYRWKRIAGLEKNSSNTIKDRELVFSVKELGVAPNNEVKKTHKGKEILLQANEDRGRVIFWLENKYSLPLYIHLFYLHPDFGITPRNIPQKRIESGKRIRLSGGVVTFFVPDHRYESIDSLLLVATTDEHTNLSSLAQKTMQTRDMEDEEVSSTDAHVWIAQTINIHTVKRLSQINDTQPTILSPSYLNNNGDIANKSGLIEIQPHTSFQAQVSLNTSASRSLGGATAAISAITQKLGLQSIALSHSRGALDDLLELDDIANEDSLKENPLQISLNLKEAGIQEGEIALPLVFDGENLLPAGEFYIDDDQKLHVAIRSIPEIKDIQGANGETLVGSRSIGKALRLTFCKLTTIQSKELQQLCWVNFNTVTNDVRGLGVSYDDFETYKKTSEEPKGLQTLKGRVAESKKCLLVIHGIIGDTQEAARSLQFTQSEEYGYDLMLTFDYESLNTPIEETARRLKQMLEAVGFSADKPLTIVAHSMGGLVSRYLIEQLGGSPMVNKLIMAGTPNAGSAIATPLDYRKYIGIAVGLAINIKTGIPLNILKGLGMVKSITGASTALTKTLEQMNSTGTFIQNLNESLVGKGETQYHVIAGDIWNKKTSHQGLINKLLTSVGWAFYQNESNDVAVSVKSIKSTGAQDIDVPCDHLSYFSNEESIDALKKILKV